MAYSLTSNDGVQVLKLEGYLTINEAEQFASWLNECLDSAKVLLVDAELVLEIDTCMLQVLCSLQKSVSSFALSNPSEIFVRAIDRRGLRRELMATRVRE